jgi:hypothetical protein
MSLPRKHNKQVKSKPNDIAETFSADWPFADWTG